MGFKPYGWSYISVTSVKSDTMGQKLNAMGSWKQQLLVSKYIGGGSVNSVGGGVENYMPSRPNPPPLTPSMYFLWFSGTALGQSNGSLQHASLINHQS